MESARAVRYAGRRAKNSNGGLVLLYVISDADFNQWIGVGEIMRAEAREEAEAIMAKVAQEVRETIGAEPELVIREGVAKDELLKLVDEDPDIRMLVLAAAPGKGGEGPGPLVSALAGQMAGDLKFPITVIPGALTDEQIDRLT